MTIVLLTKSNTPILKQFAIVFGMILEGIYNVLSGIGIGNVGISIILLTFLVNALMIPLTIRQQKFARLSAKMNPELTKIQAKYKGKKDAESMQKMNAEQQLVYQKYGASPAGGCLPLLITMPILLALYQVINNIPAYVPAINEIYMNVVNVIKENPNYAELLSNFVKGTSNAMEHAVNVPSLGRNGVVEALQGENANNYIIDVLTQFRSANWEDLMKSFSEAGTEITKAHTRLTEVNNFLGMNIKEVPRIASVTVLVPILAVITQFVQTKMSMMGNNNNKNQEETNTMAASMNAMNNFMPFMSGFFCLMFPIGIGIYWVAGNIFRIIQTFFINRYLEKIDVEVLIERNNEKKKKKMEKVGTESKTSLSEIAKKKTSSIEVEESKKETKNSEEGGKGKISEYANMLANKKNQS